MAVSRLPTVLLLCAPLLLHAAETREQLDIVGSSTLYPLAKAVAGSFSLCRPEVVACYPTTPQTPIVEHLGSMIKAGKVGSCQFTTVESEFAAMSACIGASGVGARSNTATAAS